MRVIEVAKVELQLHLHILDLVTFNHLVREVSLHSLGKIEDFGLKSIRFQCGQIKIEDILFLLTIESDEFLLE